MTADGRTLDQAQADEAAAQLARSVRPLPGVTEVSEAAVEPGPYGDADLDPARQGP